VFTDDGPLSEGLPELCGRFAEVRDVLDECDRVHREITGEPLSAGANLFAVQVALARLWRSLGAEPDLAVGHGAGEYAALHATGQIELGEGMRLAIQHIRDKPVPVIAADRISLEIGPRNAGLDALWADVARLYRGGVDINWNVLLGGCGGGRIPLPGYPFQRTTHWIGPPALATPA